MDDKCPECGRDLKPDSSYYADDGDETYSFTDESGTARVCEQCYLTLMASSHSSMDRS